MSFFELRFQLDVFVCLIFEYRFTCALYGFSGNYAFCHIIHRWNFIHNILHYLLNNGTQTTSTSFKAGAICTGLLYLACTLVVQHSEVQQGV